MTDTLRAQLQTTLGTAYTIERELGGGGMSRVFVARDEALGRDVNRVRCDSVRCGWGGAMTRNRRKTSAN